MLALGLLPKMAALVEAVPVVVLGGAGLVMFGMVAATGARILTGVDFKTNRYNLFVVAISVGFGMIPLVAPNFFKNLPHVLQPLLESGILLARSSRCCSTRSSTVSVARQRQKRTPPRRRHRRSMCEAVLIVRSREGRLRRMATMLASWIKDARTRSLPPYGARD